jgi:hypothetical protein
MNRKGWFSVILLLQICTNTPIFSFQIELKEWEINIDGTWRKTAPIYWEAAPEQGGIGMDYDGYGRYRTQFSLGKKSGHQNLAFFTACLDDADMAFLNGKFIGETGKVPSLNSARPIDEMQSGVRESRLYPIPEDYLQDRPDQPNTLEIVVFDLAGTGGFCYKQTPVIGDYLKLQKAYIEQRLFNDVPRWIAISLMLLISIFCIYLVFKKYSENLGTKGLKGCLDCFFNVLHSQFRVNTDSAIHSALHEINLEKIFRLFSLSITGVMFAIFLLSEIPIKYHLIVSERFWYQFPPLAFYIAIYFSQSVFHSEAFGHGILNQKFVGKIFYILSHPLWYIPMMIFIIFSKTESVWGFFVTSGLAYALMVHLALGIFVVIQMTRYLYFKIYLKKDRSLLKIISTQLYLRFLFLISFLAGIILFYSHGYFFNNAVLIMGTFYFLMLLISTYYFVQYEIQIPLVGSMFLKDLSSEFDTGLKTEYLLSKTEVLICRQIRLGDKRESIRKLLGLSDAGLKNHLKSIYAKTIEKQNERASGNRDKLQKLTIFLMKIG